MKSNKGGDDRSRARREKGDTFLFLTETKQDTYFPKKEKPF
jgi:hypothetical protein